MQSKPLERSIKTPTTTSVLFIFSFHSSSSLISTISTVACYNFHVKQTETAKKCFPDTKQADFNDCFKVENTLSTLTGLKFEILFL